MEDIERLISKKYQAEAKKYQAGKIEHKKIIIVVPDRDKGEKIVQMRH